MSCADSSQPIREQCSSNIESGLSSSIIDEANNGPKEVAVVLFLDDVVDIHVLSILSLMSLWNNNFINSLIIAIFLCILIIQFLGYIFNYINITFIQNYHY